MRALLAAVLVAAAAWAGWWFAGRAGAEATAGAALARLTAAGYPARHAGLTVAGFPNRFDVTLTDPQVASPRDGWTWRAPFVQVFAMAWKPWHLIAAFAPEQRLARPGGEWRLTAGRLQASVVARPGADLTLDRVVLAGDDLALSTPQGGLTAAALRAATRAAGAGDGRVHDLAVEVQGIGPGPVAWLRLRAGLTFDAALDRHLTALPGLTEVAIQDAAASRGAAGLQATGRLTADDAGLAQGEIRLTLTRWREALDQAAALGLIAPEDRPRWEAALAALPPAAAPGGNEAVEIPLRLAQGRIWLGPLALAPAPRLRPAPADPGRQRQ